MSQKSQKAKSRTSRSYGSDFRKKALERMKSCDNISALARELGVRRTRLYKWKLLAQAAATDAQEQPESAHSKEWNDQYENKIAKLQQRIAELERLVGQQTLDISFFKTALRHLEEIRRKKSNIGVNPSIKKSGL